MAAVVSAYTPRAFVTTATSRTSISRFVLYTVDTPNATAIAALRTGLRMTNSVAASTAIPYPHLLQSEKCFQNVACCMTIELPQCQLLTVQRTGIQSLHHIIDTFFFQQEGGLPVQLQARATRELLHVQP